MRRYELTDEQWASIESLLPGREGDPGAHAADNRLFVNAVIWMARTGAPWRDLPERFGEWNSVYQRFNRWSKSGIWERVFQSLQSPDLKALFLDSTIIRAINFRRRLKKENQAVGRSRGGYGTKIHLACDTRGRPLDLRLGPGQEHDSVRAAELLGELRPVAVIADKAYDANAFLQLIRHCKAEALIPPLKVRRVRRRYDKRKYRRRNLIERFVNRLKHYRRVATRYEKTARNFLAFAHIASSLVMLGVIVNTT